MFGSGSDLATQYSFFYVLLILFTIVICAFFVYLILLKKKLYDLHNDLSNAKKEIERSIDSAVTPKFIEVSIQTKDVFELAAEIWRLEHKIKKATSLHETQRDALTASLQKLKRYLEKNDVEYVDHTGQKYNEGTNLDVLSVEKDASATESVVKETKEPTILHKGRVVKKGKVVIVTKSEDGKVD